VVSTKVGSCCPLCFCPAERCHSHYTRVVADLSCAGFRIQLILHVRRFFCDNADCLRKIFTERLPAFVLVMKPSCFYSSIFLFSSPSNSEQFQSLSLFNELAGLFCQFFNHFHRSSKDCLGLTGDSFQPVVSKLSLCTS
jgi:zinc-finger of transposase IS204/IS1001/IS1096/IS1165